MVRVRVASSVKLLSLGFAQYFLWFAEIFLDKCLFHILSWKSHLLHIGIVGSMGMTGYCGEETIECQARECGSNLIWSPL